ncbi:MAG: hypothetical protein JOZ07_01235 [Solirubrobacterales bacterium]|nr:hypothetical protein [Solirubrobacterales bacterium]
MDGGAPISSPRLRQLAQRSAQASAAEQEHCELCGAPVPAGHRHLIDLRSRELLCACRPCSLLFDRAAAGGGHFRLVPDRRLRLEDFALEDQTWEQLRIPVDMAYFFYNSSADRVVAFYPSPMGATESRLELETWREVERANPVLAGLAPDVEALLVNRARGARRHWLVPVEDCYRLVALIRTRWRGFTGGREVWTEIDRFFDSLDRQARLLAPATAQPPT